MMSNFLNTSALESKDNILEALHDSVCTVEFVKADGTDRIMECTLNTKIVPSQPVKENAVVKVTKPLANHLVRVYDVDAAGWRTINLNTVKTFIQN